MAVELEPSWLKVLGDEFDKPYMAELKKFLKEERMPGIKYILKTQIYLMHLTKPHSINLRLLYLARILTTAKARLMACHFPCKKV